MDWLVDAFNWTIPVAGGVIGAGLDLLLLNKIAANAREQFPTAGA